MREQELRGFGGVAGGGQRVIGLPSGPITLGPNDIARLGEFADDRAGLLGVLARMHDEGDMPIALHAR